MEYKIDINDLKNDLQKSFEKHIETKIKLINKELENNLYYKKFTNQILDIPVIKETFNENKKLKEEIEILKQKLELVGSKNNIHLNISDNSDNTSKNTDNNIDIEIKEENKIMEQYSTNKNSNFVTTCDGEALYTIDYFEKNKNRYHKNIESECSDNSDNEDDSSQIIATSKENPFSKINNSNLEEEHESSAEENDDEEDEEPSADTEEDANAFECDDCNYKGTDCYEQIGLTKEESIVYMDLGEPDRCEDCFDKWKNTSDANDYLKQTEEEQQEASASTSVQASASVKAETIKLCENMDCERHPPDWDDEEDTEDTYQEGQWKKCNLCDGYFDDDGMGDILYVQEKPHNKEAECDLCGKTKDIVQMKGTGEYLCGNACDEEEEEEEEEVEINEPSADEEEEEVEINEPSADEEEEETEINEPSADEEEEETEINEPSADEEEEETEINEPSADEDVEIEQSADEEEDEEEEVEIEQSVDEEEDEEEEEEEVFEIKINKKIYFTNDENDGNIYQNDNGSPGNLVGVFIKGKPKIN